MDPQSGGQPVATTLKLSPRKLAIAGGVLAALAIAVVVVVLLTRGGGAPGQAEVAAELRAAIEELAPERNDVGARYDTAALRSRLEGELDGWFIDLAADTGATRVGVAARQIEGSTCVFAWSDVGAARSANVGDPALPCVAEISLKAAKPPA